MVKRNLEVDNTERFETVKECLEAAIKEEEVRVCYYDFLANGSCGYELFESSHGHVAEPKDMIRIAEKFFTEFGWVHFEGLGKNGNVYISCYLAEETKDSFTEKRIQIEKDRKNKLIEEWRKNKTDESYEKLKHSIRYVEEWKEK